jgi:hypothetical protein
VWAGVVSIVTGATCAPFVVLGSIGLRTVLILALSIVTQLVSGATLLFAALAARDTDRMTNDD